MTNRAPQANQVEEVTATGALIVAKPFWLVRTEDESGVSGTGVVADGAKFPDGTCVLRWRTCGGSTGIYDSEESVIEIHGHGGRTVIEYPLLHL